MEPGQLAGRLLQLDDITPNLKGRQAQLFWPEDGLWYPVEIQAINTRSKQAKYVYRGCAAALPLWPHRLQPALPHTQCRAGRCPLGLAPLSQAG